MSRSSSLLIQDALSLRKDGKDPVGVRARFWQASACELEEAKKALAAGDIKGATLAFLGSATCAIEAENTASFILAAENLLREEIDAPPAVLRELVHLALDMFRGEEGPDFVEVPEERWGKLLELLGKESPLDTNQVPVLPFPLRKD